MKLKFTKSDHDRAFKMGWRIYEGISIARVPYFVIKTCGPDDPSPFKSDREAVEWVIQITISCGYHFHSQDDNWKTCHKALLLCCLGATQ